MDLWVDHSVVAVDLSLQLLFSSSTVQLLVGDRSDAMCIFANLLEGGLFGGSCLLLLLLGQQIFVVGVGVLGWTGTEADGQC